MTGLRAAIAVALATMATAGVAVQAQTRGGGPPPTAKATAPFDMTGYWVAFVSEDWRYRMMTPPKGDYTRVPLNPEGRRVADSWDAAADEAGGRQCRAFGAGAIMRLPGRLHVTWQDDNTLRVDTDAGTQTRLFRFGASAAAAAKSWQGESGARWDAATKSLTVVTSNVLSGYLRPNGVPYSENATITEYIDVVPATSGQPLLVVTTVVVDPVYLQRPFVLSSQFKKERDGAKWNPTPCSARW